VVKVINQRKLGEIRREWQKRLRLQDWKIKISFADEGFMKEVSGLEDGAYGAVEHFVEDKEAKIYILRAEDWGEVEGDFGQAVENTVVHELLHLHFAPFQTGDESSMILQEQAIRPIADALLELKRAK